MHFLIHETDRFGIINKIRRSHIRREPIFEYVTTIV